MRIASKKIKLGLEFALVLAIASIWSLMLLQPSRGLDLTDEGLYLLAISGAYDHTWGTPWGWHVRPLAELVFRDLTALRLLNSCLILILSYYYGAVLTIFLKNGTNTGGVPESDLVRVLNGLAAMASGSLFFGAMLMRTPNYNSVNLVGLLIAGMGLLLLASQAPSRNGPNFLAGLPHALIAFGVFVALPAKPTTAVFVAIALVSVSFLTSRGELVKDLAITGAFGLALVSLALVLRLWPLNFLEVLLGQLNSPVLTSRHRLEGATLSLLEIPKDLVQALYGLGTFNATALLLLGLLVTLFARKNWPGLAAISVLGTAGATAFLVVSLTHSFVQADTPLRFASSNTALFGWLYLLLAVGIATGFGKSRVSKAEGLFAIPLVVSVSAAFGISFGSANGAFGQSSLAASFLLVLLLAAIQISFSDKLRLALTAGIASILVAVALVFAGDSQVRPYRMDAFSLQVNAIDAGPFGTIYVSSNTISQIDAFEQALDAAEWRSDIPLISLVWRWNSTLPLIAGAPSVPTLMPTLFGYPGSLHLLEHNLEILIEADVAFWGSAYLITDNPAFIGQEVNSQIEQAKKLVALAFSKDFESSYQLAASTDRYQVWRPIPPAQSARD